MPRDKASINAFNYVSALVNGVPSSHIAHPYEWTSVRKSIAKKRIIYERTKEKVVFSIVIRRFSDVSTFSLFEYVATNSQFVHRRTLSSLATYWQYVPLRTKTQPYLTSHEV